MRKWKIATKWQLLHVKLLLNCYLSTSMATPDGKTSSDHSGFTPCYFVTIASFLH